MEKIAVYCSWADQKVLSDQRLLTQLPNEIADSIRTAKGSQYFQGLVSAFLTAEFTDRLFALYEPLAVEVFARIYDPEQSSEYDEVAAVCAAARILPFAPYLKPCLLTWLENELHGRLAFLSDTRSLQLSDCEAERLSLLLLAVFRLLSSDFETFQHVVSPIQLFALFKHASRGVRYLAIRCFSLQMKFSDARTEALITSNLDGQPVPGQWEDRAIDYRYLSLWEERRWHDLTENLQHARVTRSSEAASATRDVSSDSLSPRTTLLGNVLVPRSQTKSTLDAALIATPTTNDNLSKLASALLDTRPVIMVGQAGAGKTSLVNEAARRLGTISSLITLHLNEQTDAKGLLGIYTASAGTFQWQPGVLTRAVQQGRWVIIEDLDRAPQEVIGTLLPLIEQGRLFIPSRKERIRPSPGFRLFATLKSRLNTRGEETSDLASILGSRLWNPVHVEPLQFEEIREILATKYPLLEKLLPLILSSFRNMDEAVKKYRLTGGASLRHVGLRDLLKWCSRIQSRLRKQGAKTSHHAISGETNDYIFLDAIDCFARNIPNLSTRAEISSIVAQHMQLSPQRMDFLLHERLPSHEEAQSSLRVGREFIPMAVQRPIRGLTFSWTRHAARLLEACAAGIQMAEPLLLVGETGIGKTTAIQYLAKKLGKNLTVINLSQQSESSDILGGFKPVTTRSLVLPMTEEFNELFDKTFSAKRNGKFLNSIAHCIKRQNYSRLALLWEEAVKMAENNLGIKVSQEEPNDVSQKPPKRRKIEGTRFEPLRPRWIAFASKLESLRASVSRESNKFAFAFVEGKVVQALRNGDWVLLDEINLAAPDTLEAIIGLLNNGDEGSPTAFLAESGQTEKIVGHKDFRVFAAMNPATDAGKRDLPSGIRARFTEIFVEPPDRELSDLLTLIDTYIGDLTVSDRRLSTDLAQLYLAVQDLNDRRQLTDGAGNIPHFSIRTLVRSLLYLRRHVGTYGLRRALYEGFCMSFLTLLSKDSELALVPLLDKHLLASQKNARSLLRQSPRPPSDSADYVQFNHYWVTKGPLEPSTEAHYIITPFVERNLLNLARAVSMKTFPILLQGPTSSGKTSMVEYLAKISGHEFVRINNHEHTDLQEYLGSYASDEEGRLHYREGILVRALRQGHWVVLDELNLAPTDVLEALNRLLDDNRELFIPETQEIVRPHPNFMLFATQNPAGAYGGRKHLSRAFRNRFLELHFDDIPEDELEFILKERAQIPPSFCSNIVTVYKRLSILRQSSRLFEQRHSFATLRDLFRWALRKAEDRSQLAINGYMLLAERIREHGEKEAVKKIIEDVTKVKLDESVLYGHSSLGQAATDLPQGVIWTSAARRLAVLILKAIENSEPVLLIGETGGGKTQIFQTISHMLGKPLQIVNAHVNLETGDLIGAQRPIRNRAAIEEALRADLAAFLRSEVSPNESLDHFISAFQNHSTSIESDDEKRLHTRIQSNLIRRQALFEWADGSLVSAMKAGEHFLLDEISLADDSVLERLNSVLEPSRTILLAEKGGDDASVTAAPSFQFFATMNPGGDYGKRELSAALRNRLTEIWVPSLSDEEDIAPILQQRLAQAASGLPDVMLQFSRWFKDSFSRAANAHVSLRDLLAWVDFILASEALPLPVAVVHGAALVYIDGLGANPATSMVLPAEDVIIARQQCLVKLTELLKVDATEILNAPVRLAIDDNSLRIGHFHIERPSKEQELPNFAFDAPTTLQNALRVIRALQLDKPILLEGDPGVGKTTLVAAIAQASGKKLTRINLSEQTDLMDLFGSDIPLEGEAIGQFAWRDGPFLRAMQAGEWVLLDEMNLASQSVLEGLNACLDHRKQVFITELGQTFYRHPDFILFAAQNPHTQGGGRKGLPASFVNRFTVVFAETLVAEDLAVICRQAFGNLPNSYLREVISLTSRVVSQIQNDRRLAAAGGPWDINLRDMFRWLQLCSRGDVFISPKRFARLILIERFRTPEQRRLVQSSIDSFFSSNVPINDRYYNLSVKSLQVGFAFVERNQRFQYHPTTPSCFTPQFLPVYEALAHSVTNRWPLILVGPSGCGKTVCIRDIASIQGAKLIELTLNGDTDSMDLIGGFEQIDPRRAVASSLEKLSEKLQSALESSIGSYQNSSIQSILSLTQVIRSRPSDLIATLDHLSKIADTDSTYKPYLELLQTSTTDLTLPESPSFAWTDGILIEAMEKGSWVVLDNANLCNASVLDRLNSLMEPSRTLIITEQHRPDGSPRVIQAHPDFRIFITMDPKFGELSKAMRNRCIEIFLDQSLDQSRTLSNSTPAYRAESRTTRLRVLDTIRHSNAMINQDISSTALDHLSYTDLNDIHHELQTLPADKTLDSLLPLYARLYLNQNIRSIGAGTLDQLAISETGDTVSNSELDMLALHPMINEPAISVLPPNQLKMLLAKCSLIDLSLDFMVISAGLDDKKAEAYQKKIADLTVLERSLAAERLPGSTNRAKAGLALFVSNLSQSFQNVIKAAVVETSQSNFSSLDPIDVYQVLYWIRDLVRITDAANLDAATFQVYLQFGHGLSRQFSTSNKSIAGIMDEHLKLFDHDWKLSFGKSLGRMWRTWRPWTPTSSTQLELLIRLQNVTHKFNGMISRLHLPLRHLAQLRSSLQEVTDVRQMSTSHIDGFLGDFEQTITQLENSVDPEDKQRSLFLQPEFEGIAQCLDMVNVPDLELKSLVELLAGRLLTINRTQDSSEPSAILEKLTKYSGQAQSTESQGIKGDLALKVAQRLSKSKELRLSEINSAESSSKVMLRALATLSDVLHLDHTKLLTNTVWSLQRYILLSHTDLLTPAACEILERGDSSNLSIFSMSQDPTQILFKSSIPSDHYFYLIAQNYLLPAMRILVHDQVTLPDIGYALFNISIAILRLMVPDRPYDPAVDLIVERERYWTRHSELQTKLQALSQFEAVFTGATTTFRTHLTVQQLAKLGEEPPPPSVVRPSISRSQEIQAEFTVIVQNLLVKEPENILISGDPSISWPQREAETTLLRRSVGQLVSRLSHLPVEYFDLTQPISQTLQCLAFAADLVLLEKEGSDTATETVRMISSRTPLLGGMVPLHTFDDGAINHQPKSDLDIRFHGLERYGFWQIDLADGSDRNPDRSAMIEILQSFYQDWKIQLMSDQQSEEKKSRMYEYRGLDDTDDAAEAAEMRDMFPTFDQDQLTSNHETKPPSDAKLTATRLAKIVWDISNRQGSDADLESYLMRSFDTIVALLPSCQPKLSPLPSTYMLAPLTLRLEKHCHNLRATEQSSSPDFYHAVNIREVNRLIDLVTAVKARFKQIRDAWPEHATPQDVLLCCKEVLEFSIEDPLAKIITKVEKLHTYINEWQTVASREFSADQIFQRVGDLLIQWRRLELLSWSRLIDGEETKVQEEARSWWFVLYEVLVAIPVQIFHDNGDMVTHCKDLADTLIKFLQTTSIGQFIPRLDLLQSFDCLFPTLISESAQMELVQDTVHNIVNHFTYFRKATEATLGEGRSKFERDVKEQVQLASWKDTNVTALRDSARRSHHSLFKIVRKYRAFLAKPFEVPTNLPMSHSEQFEVHHLQELPSARDGESAAQNLLASNLVGWSAKPDRLRKPTSAAAMMRDLYSSLPETVEIHDELWTFSSTLLSNISSLKKETPSKLTEENKELVQHLKTRKRKLLAETIRFVRHMGVSRNLSTEELERQNSSAIILATVPSLNGVSKPAADLGNDWFHALVDLLPAIRHASVEHSDDLAVSDVGRSIGSIEGFVYLLRAQRTTLLPALADLQRLDRLLQQIRNLRETPVTETSKTSPDLNKVSISKQILCLMQILKVGRRVLEVQAENSQTDLNQVITGLQKFQTSLQQQRESIGQIPSLPLEITSLRAMDILQMTQETLSALGQSLKQWSSDFPNISYLLSQILPWTALDALHAVHTENGMEVSSIDDIDKAITATADTIFVALQKLQKIDSEPLTMDDPGWLIQTDRYLKSSIKALHIGQVTSGLEQVLRQLNFCSAEPDQVAIAVTLVTVFLPVFEQYHRICDHVLTRYAADHGELCYTAYSLGKSFTQIASEGFCSPPDQSSDDAGEGKVESGTGLGEGEGAEDISKDVAEDEDLSEFAQQQNEKGDQGEIDAAEDAVNMDREDLEGEMDDMGEEREAGSQDEGSDEEDQGNEMDEEVGSVDNLDPSTVDEKLWDGLGKENEKELEDDKAQGQADNDDTAATSDQKPQPEADTDQGDDGEDGEASEAEDEGEAVGREEIDQTDPHLQQDQSMDIPEEMQLDGDQDGKESSLSDEDLDALSDVEQPDQADAGSDIDGQQQEDPQDETLTDGVQDDVDEEKANQPDTDEVKEEPVDEEESAEHVERDDEQGMDQDEDATGESGHGGEISQEQVDNTNPDRHNSSTASKDRQDEQDEKGEQTDPTQDDGEGGEGAAREGAQHGESPSERQLEAFKKLGDVLERWHRQREILQSSEDQRDEQINDVDMADADFEHLKSEEETADTQALGSASKDQARALDQSQALEDSEMKADEDNVPPDVGEIEKPDLTQLLEETQRPSDSSAQPNPQEQSGSFIPDRNAIMPETNGGQNATDQMTDPIPDISTISLASSSSELPPLTDFQTASRLWHHYSGLVHPLSLTLTEQLRLILTPTLSSKLRGDYRTGKRLNIKRIIPYIASNYKRDKIWLRRSHPSKRNYQILLAVDDSKSMSPAQTASASSSPGLLALETVALLSKSLSMLEVGDLSIVSFGAESHIRIAHPFGTPFTNEAGPRVFQNFSYAQNGTNVKLLVEESIALFRDARAKNNNRGGSGTDLWQLMLIISDGLCENHDDIRRLVRQAKEERIIIVFIIVDSSPQTTTTASSGAGGAGSSTSILDLTSATFEPDGAAGDGEMKLKIRRYLETFPFQYYLVVRDVRELPAVLGTALMGWFREVVESS